MQVEGTISLPFFKFSFALISIAIPNCIIFIRHMKEYDLNYSSIFSTFPIICLQY